MIRIAAIPALLAASPALAHSDTVVHLHETDGLTLTIGLALIVAGGLAALAAKGRGL